MTEPCTASLPAPEPQSAEMGTMSTTLVRWATRWDRTALIAMVQALAQQHGVEASEDTIGAAFEFALGNPGRVRFAVAQRDDQLVGTASLHEAYSTWRAALYGTIEDFYVVPEMRGGNRVVDPPGGGSAPARILPAATAGPGRQ